AANHREFHPLWGKGLSMSRYGLEGKVAVVTGSARGIGFAIAQRLASEGCQVVLTDINGEGLAEAVKQFDAANALAVTADVSNKDDVRRLFSQTVERFGGVDILINNAALMMRRRWLSQLDEDQFDKILQVNVRSTYLCSRQAAVSMAKRGG